MKEVKPVVTEQKEFQYCDESKIKSSFCKIRTVGVFTQASKGNIRGIGEWKFSGIYVECWVWRSSPLNFISKLWLFGLSAVSRKHQNEKKSIQSGTAVLKSPIYVSMEEVSSVVTEKIELETRVTSVLTAHFGFVDNQVFDAWKTLTLFNQRVRQNVKKYKWDLVGRDQSCSNGSKSIWKRSWVETENFFANFVLSGLWCKDPMKGLLKRGIPCRCVTFVDTLMEAVKLVVL